MGKEEEMFSAVEKIGQQHIPEVDKGIHKLVDNLLVHAMLPKDALGVSDTNVEKIYTEAYRLYNNGKYRDAQQLFCSLILLNTLEPKYLFGLAACHHMMKDYENAANNYIRSAMLDPGNPIPYYHASDCYLQMQDNISAMAALNMVIKRAGSKSEFATIRDRCQLTLEKLLKEESTNPLNKDKE